MRNLLSANFARLRRDKCFLLCIGTMLLYAVLYMLNGCRLAATDLSEYHYSLDQYYFHFAVIIGIFPALLSGMFLGTEYSDGTIRNKIIVGHTRTHIYLAGQLTLFTATLLITLVWLIGALVAVPTLGLWKMSAQDILICLCIAVLFEGAFAAIFTFLSMLSTNKAVTVVLTLLLFLGLLILASMLYNALLEPETVSELRMTVNGIETGEPAPNPRYISGITREIYAFLLDVLPTGQGLQMWQLELGHPLRMLLSSAAITAAATFGGLALFSKKDLK